jgi:hypothetical protein
MYQPNTALKLRRQKLILTDKGETVARSLCTTRQMQVRDLTFYYYSTVLTVICNIAAYSIMPRECECCQEAA